MNARENSQAALRDAIQGGKAILVAGTGVSISATFDPSKKASHPQASWTGLLIHGLTWLKEHRLVDSEEAQAQLLLLNRRSPQTHHFVSAAQDVVAGMGGPRSDHFRNWLGSTVGTIRATDHRVLDALHCVRQHGNLLATTNYDSLLLGDSLVLSPVTWRDSDEFVGAVRGRDTSKVIFLHGYWRRPESVILDWNSYHAIAQARPYRDDLAACWKLHTWVYVGCGANGLGDPDLGLLLERYGKRAQQAGQFDFCLVRNSEREAFDSFFREKNFNILAVPYGADHRDLAPYLHSLLPATVAVFTSAPQPSTAPSSSSISQAPALCAVPPYIGSHDFVGRDTQLEELSDWAKPEDPTNLLLFEAIGGTGKSMLTWEWTTNSAHALASRTGADAWAGRFWYSFYEPGAVMAHFCQHALAYMTGRPLEEFRKKKTAQLIEPLLAELHAKPWLVVLDGLERVLVAYHCIDAAQLPDEDASSPSDKIIDRNPRDAIRDEDNDLLRALAAAKPSKILVSSRLTPRVLLNPSDQPINGVKRISLPGLRPPDAEKLLRACGVTGDSSAIQRYLATNCDNHPLVIGVLAGLISNYLPARGDFDVWASRAEGGGKLDLGSLDLINRRNHILKTAVDALAPKSRQLLSTLSLLRDSIDYKALEALNPHIPPAPTYVGDPVDDRQWRTVSTLRKRQRAEYQRPERLRQNYLKAFSEWQQMATSLEARKALRETVRDLEIRGLLQFDRRNDRYDLHPVVRGAISRFQSGEGVDAHGQRIVDYFSSVPQRTYKEVDTLEDLRPALNTVGILLKLGRPREATRLYTSDLSTVLLHNLEAYSEVLALTRAFFPDGWERPSSKLEFSDTSLLMAAAAVALGGGNEWRAAVPLWVSNLSGALKIGYWKAACSHLNALAVCHRHMSVPATAARLGELSLQLATVIDHGEALFNARLGLFYDLGLAGCSAEAEAVWNLLDPMGRAWSRKAYRSGSAEYLFARFMFWRGILREEHLATAERLATEGRSRHTIRNVCQLRGIWYLDQGKWERAAASLSEALSMSRAIGSVDEACETRLALAKLHLGQLAEPKHVAERLGQLRNPAHYELAKLWLGLGDSARARQHAMTTYKKAWADGEPYVKRHDLTRATELLTQLDIPIPSLPKYDPAQNPPFAWEADVCSAIEQLKAEKK